MSQPNQFTKARERGEPMPYRAPHKLDDATKDKIRAELLARRLYKYAKASGEKAKKYSMEPAQVQAAKVLIDRGKPVLQAVEQRNVGEFEGKSEDELVASVNALILANPGLIERLGIGLRPVQSNTKTDIPDSGSQQAA